MDLKKFFALDEEHYLTPEQAQVLHQLLSEASILDIPLEKREQVIQLLTISLNLNAVEPMLISKLDLLLSQLQESKR